MQRTGLQSAHVLSGSRLKGMWSSHGVLVGCGYVHSTICLTAVVAAVVVGAEPVQRPAFWRVVRVVELL